MLKTYTKKNVQKTKRLLLITSGLAQAQQHARSAQQHPNMWLQIKWNTASHALQEVKQCLKFNTQGCLEQIRSNVESLFNSHPLLTR